MRSALPQLSDEDILQAFKTSGDPLLDPRNGLTFPLLRLDLALGYIGIAGGAEAGDRFGEVTAAGDVDGDGHQDLAIGVPGETIGSTRKAGAVNVIYGGPLGLGNPSNQMWYLGRNGAPGSPAASDGLGSAVAVGDFDADGFDDLAVGIPGKRVRGYSAAGALLVLRGSSEGLVATGARIWDADVSRVPGPVGSSHRFGSSLASTDFNRDGYADLAVGVPGAQVRGISVAGSVNVFYGSASGLMASYAQLWSQDSPGIKDTVAFGDSFGLALATGDFDGDGAGDLAIGAPGEYVGGGFFAGAVNVLYGRLRTPTYFGGLTARDQLFHQDTPGVQGGAEAWDRFGESLAAGDFDGDGRDDLAIGVPLEDVDGVTNAGMVNVLYGARSGLTTAGDQVWHQDRPGIKDTNERFDHFGRALAAGDFDGDGRDDLAVGVPGEHLLFVPDSGMVSVLYGSSSGLSAVDQTFDQTVSDGVGSVDAPEHYDELGRSLSVGDFDGDGYADLAIGVPKENEGNAADSGMVHVLQGSASRLRDVRAQTWSQER